MKKLYFSLIFLFIVSSVIAQTTAIPDTNFEQALIDLGIDSDGTINGQVLTSDISGIASLNLHNKNISDLTGIEDFNSLTVLYCSSNNLTSLNVTNNINLQELGVAFNQLTSIDVSQNINLIYLGCYGNQLINLDVTQNINLQYLDSQSNQLSSLDITQNIALKELLCMENELSSLDVSQNVDLKQLYCFENQIKSIDLFGASSLEILDCSINKIESLDLSLNKNLSSLNCTANKLLFLNMKNGNNSNIITFESQNNTWLTCIQVDNAEAANAGELPYGEDWWIKDDHALYSEECSQKMIPDPNFEQALIDLGLDSDGIINGKINPDDVKDVTSLDVQNKNISDLTGIAYFISLTKLNCSNNQILKLNISTNDRIQTLNCSNNKIVELLTPLDKDPDPGDYDEWVSLSNLDCSNNELSSLDLTKNFNIGALNCSFNKIESLALAPDAYLGYGGQFKLAPLTTLDCSNNFIVNLDLSRNLGIKNINCSMNSINDLVFPDRLDGGGNDGYGNKQSISNLNCNNNQLTYLDVSKISVGELYCDNNQISNLVLPGSYYNNYIGTLSCNNNELTSLGIAEGLKHLFCSNNSFKSFDLKPNYYGLLTLDISNNQLNSLNLINDSDRTIINNLDARGNSDLYCITVENKTEADNNQNFLKDDFTEFKEVSCLPWVQLSSDKDSIHENGEKAVIYVTLDYKSISDVTIDLSTSGTALSTNYELSSNNIIIPAGDLTASVTLTAKEDDMDGDKTVIIDIDSVENALEETLQQITINIIHINNPPTNITLEETEFEENITVNELTKIIVDDIDDTTHTITLVVGDGSDDNSDFSVTGDILSKNIDFDYETKNEYLIRIKTEDSGGLFIEKSFIITIINVNDIVITGVIVNTFCGNDEIGSITTTVEQYIPPLYYSWSSGETTANISNKPNGTYTLTVTDAENMVQSKEFIIESEPIYSSLTICYVTSDDVSPDNNRLFFNNENAYNLDKIQILREGSVAGYYDVIAEILPNESSYLDASSDNQVQSYNYVVRIKDKCGNISESSASHKTVLLQANKAADGTINLSWSAYEGLNYGTYDIYRKENNEDYTLLTSLSSSNLSYNDTDATSNTKSYSYYIGITLNVSCNFTSNAVNKSSLANEQIKSNIKFIQSTLGVDDEILAEGLNMFPNPVNNSLHIESKLPLTKVEFYSILGQLIKEVNSDYNSISTDNLSRGIYLIRIYSERGTVIRKLIKQ